MYLLMRCLSAACCCRIGRALCNIGCCRDVQPRTAMCAETAVGRRSDQWWATSLEYSARSNCLVSLYKSNRWPTKDRARLIAFDLDAGGRELCSANDPMCTQPY